MLLSGGVDTDDPSALAEEQQRVAVEVAQTEELLEQELNCETVERGRPSPRETNKKPRRRTRPPVRFGDYVSK